MLLAPVPAHGILGPTLKVLSKYPFTFLKANLTLNLHKIVANPIAAKKLLFSDSLPTETANHYQSQMQNEAYIGYLDMMLFNLPKTKKINMPNLLIIGAEDDKVISKKDLERTANTYQATLKTIPDLAHDIMLDTNWETAANTVKLWLSDK